MSETNQSQPSKSIISSARKLVGLLGAFAGIFVALLYLTGRSYAYGFFSAMNIPEYMISYSTWEYGAAAWSPLFLYTTIAMVISSSVGYLIAIFFEFICSRSFMLRFKKWIQERWQKLISNKTNTPENSDKWLKLSNWYGLIFYVFMFLFLIFFSFTHAIQYIQENGRLRGQSTVLFHSMQVELVTKLPVIMDGNESISSLYTTAADQYIYNGFRLLTMNNGKYYVFKELDPQTCIPAHVYVINAESVNQLVLGPAESLSDLCEIPGEK